MGQPFTLHAEGFTAFLGEHVAVLVLDHTIEVKPCDPLSNSGLAHTQGDVTFDAFPEVAFKRGQSDVLLHLLLVLLNDIENHQVVLIHEVESCAVNRSGACPRDTGKIGADSREPRVFKISDMYNLFTL